MILIVWLVGFRVIVEEEEEAVRLVPFCDEGLEDALLAVVAVPFKLVLDLVRRVRVRLDEVVPKLVFLLAGGDRRRRGPEDSIPSRQLPP